MPARALRNHKADFGSPQFPTPTGGTGKQIGKVTDGTSAGEVFYDCLQCGFPIDGSRVQSSGGTSDGSGGIDLVTQGTIKDPQVKRGFCPFCGTANSQF